MPEYSPETWARIRRIASWSNETLEFFRRDDPLYALLIEWAREKAARYQELSAVCEAAV